MKRLLMSFLMAGLMITSALSLSSCKKTTDTNGSKWIPTTFDFVGGGNGLSRDVHDFTCPYDGIILNYCNHGVQWWTRDPITGEQTICPLGVWDPVENPDGHYHVHCFTSDVTPGGGGDCTPPGQTNYICKYYGREHRHIVVIWQEGWDNHWHVGGGCCGQ